MIKKLARWILKDEIAKMGQQLQAIISDRNRWGTARDKLQKDKISLEIELRRAKENKEFKCRRVHWEPKPEETAFPPFIKAVEVFKVPSSPDPSADQSGQPIPKKRGRPPKNTIHPNPDLVV